MKPLGPKLRALKASLDKIPAKVATAVACFVTLTLSAPAEFLFWSYRLLSPKKPKRPLSHWGVLNGLVWIVGAYLSFPTITNADTASTVNSRLVESAVTGLLIVGVAQLMRGSAHGAASDGGRRVDGLGKALGVFGWSLGAGSAVLSQAMGTEVAEETLVTTAWVLASGGVLATAISLVPVNLGHGGAAKKGASAKTATEMAPEVKPAKAVLLEPAPE